MRRRLSDLEAWALIFGVGAFVLGTFAFGWVMESTAAAVVALGFALAFIVGSIAYAIRRAGRVVDVSLDEGGVRVRPRAGGHHHVPFEELRDAKMERSFGRVALRLVGAHGTRTYLLESAPDGIAAEIRSGIAQRSAAAPALWSLARGGQPLDAWLARLRDLATPDYRERPLDHDALLATVLDTKAPTETRAAAAHVLVWLRDHEKATKVMGALGARTPPLVVVLAALATKHGTYVEQYDRAAALLSPADRSVAERMMEERPKLRVAAPRGAEGEPLDDVEPEAADAARRATR